MPPHAVDNDHGNNIIVGKLIASPQTDIEVSHNSGVDNIIVDMTINSGDSFDNIIEDIHDRK